MADRESAMIEIKEAAPGAAPGVNISDLFKYGELLNRVISVWQGLNLGIGSSVELGWTRVRYRGGVYRWTMGKIEREK